MHHKMRLVIGGAVALFALVSYCSSSEVNPVTGRKQYLSLKPEQEIALGLQAAPEMAQRHGGHAPDAAMQARVDAVGGRLVANSAARDTTWRYEFHALADTKSVNAFALPGGQIFITRALLEKLRNDDQLAAVLAHEISHVIARHGAQRLAKMELTQGLTGAAVVASGDYNAGQLAAAVGQMVTMKYSREDELESDALGVRLMREAGYDPHAMIEVMRILEQSTGRGRPTEFFSTHPNPENRVQRIREAIAKLEGNYSGAE